MAVKHLISRIKNAIRRCKTNYPNMQLVVSGGVAANSLLQNELQKLCDSFNILKFNPPVEYCTDNGVMVAW